MQYDYIIVDTKLLAFQTFHRKQGILRMIPLLTRALYYNKIDYNNSVIVWAGDVDKSAYRVGLWKEYKMHRKELQKRASKSEQERRDIFIKEYNTLHDLLVHIGVNGILKDTEADDMVTIIRHLRPNANILMVSLDLDWLLNVNDKTHLLFFSNNTLYTNVEQVTEKIGIRPDLYLHLSAIGGQAKDNIINIQQFGKARFIKHCIDAFGNLKVDYGTIIDRLLAENKYGMQVSPKAKYRDWRDNYQLNLQLMSPIPINLVDIDELRLLDKRLDRKHEHIEYEDFLMQCFNYYENLPELGYDEFTKLRNK